MVSEDPRARRDRHDLSWHRALWLAVRLTISDFTRDRGVERSAALSYVTLLSLVPLLATASALYGAFFPVRVEELIQALTGILPYAPGTVAETLTEFVERTSALSAVGSLVFLLVAFRLFLSIESAFNDIWGVTQARTPATRMFSFTMLVFWGPVVMGVVATVMVWIPASPGIETALEWAREVVLLVGLTMVYWLAPHTRVRVRSALAGACVATVGLIAVRLVFASSIRSFADLNLIYGSLALVVIFLMSLFAFWTLVLLGAEAAFVVENFQALAGEHQGRRPRAADREAVGLAILLEVCARHARGDPAPTLETLEAVLGVAGPDAHELSERMVAAGVLGVTGSDRERFVPGREAAHLDLAVATDAILGPRSSPWRPGSSERHAELDRLLDRLEAADAARKTTLAGTRLSDILDPM